jgi:exosortase K
MKTAMKQKVFWSAQLLLVALCALALKFYYSTATPDELRWILAPTTLLVELLSREQFEFESYAGYMSSDRSFVIAVPCAGVNFLITAFLMLAPRTESSTNPHRETAHATNVAAPASKTP